jgi:hypothetical protein
MTVFTLDVPGVPRDGGRRLPALVRRLGAIALAACGTVALTLSPACTRKSEHRTFATPEEAVRVLHETVKSGNMDNLLAIFGPEGRELVASSDPATTRRNQEVFLVAYAEGWRLGDLGPDRKELVVGHEEWPFPVPLVKDGRTWRFDTAAGKEEVLRRRIGRNELAVLRICDTYVLAQRAYASQGHDGKRAGVYARRFASEPGTQNGLYWPTRRGERRSPLGDLVAQAAEEGRPLGGQQGPAPFHGYHFRILEAQGPSAPGGAADYVVNGSMTGGFALVAWPSEYDVTGVMTFLVGRDRIVYEKDLGPETQVTASAMRRYDPDSSWQRASADSPGEGKQP